MGAWGLVLWGLTGASPTGCEVSVVLLIDKELPPDGLRSGLDEALTGMGCQVVWDRWAAPQWEPALRSCAGSARCMADVLRSVAGGNRVAVVSVEGLPDVRIRLEAIRYLDLSAWPQAQLALASQQAPWTAPESETLGSLMRSSFPAPWRPTKSAPVEVTASPSHPKRGFWRTPWPWVLGAVVVAGAAGAVAAIASSNQDAVEFCFTLDPADCP